MAYPINTSSAFWVVVVALLAVVPAVVLGVVLAMVLAVVLAVVLAMVLPVLYFVSYTRCDLIVYVNVKPPFRFN
jgi:hypothetical protein